MKEYRASTTIAAPPERIWAILTDGTAYPEWEPNTVRIDGRIGPGEKLTAFSKLSPGRAFPVKVTEFVPGQKMTWIGGMPLGLFTGERSFVLAPRGDGATEFTLREVFSGPLLSLIGRSLPDLNAAFAQFAASLKKRAEASSEQA
jgi:hypothetical protein